jgi:hypothetical protein
MKIKATIALLAILLFFSADCTFLMVPAVSSASLSLSSARATGQSAPDPLAVKNFQSNITISGNLNITGKSTVVFAGISSSNPVNVYLNGSVFIRDNATFVLKYANLYFMGATKPYGRNITLSNSPNGHPQLDIGPAVVIDAYTSASIVIGKIRNPRTGQIHNVTATASYGAAIYAYNNSQINADGLTFYRQQVYANYSLGGPTLIECLGESSATLTQVNVESLITYGAANVTVYSGDGTIAVGKTLMGIVLGCYNTSMINLDNVYFQSIVASDEAHMLLDHCTETGSSITTKDSSRVDFAGGTVLNPVVNATGDSYVSLSSSKLSTILYNITVVSIIENATFAILHGGSLSGFVLAVDNSRVVLNSTGQAGALGSLSIVSRDSSSVSIFNSTFNAFPYPIVLSFFDGSKLSVIHSTVAGALLSLFNESAAYILNSQISSTGSGLRIVGQDNANVTIINSAISADSMEMSDEASLSMESSSVWMVNCLNSSQVSIGQDSLVSELSVRDSARVQVYNSTLLELSVTEQNVKGSLSGLTGLIRNSTLALSGSTLRIGLLNTKVNVGFTFSGFSNVTISNSTLSNLSLLGSSVVTLNNASVSASPYVLGNSKIFIYSFVRVHCVDYFGNPISGSVVTISSYPGAKPHGIADKNGFASFAVFSEMDNATGSFPFGTATVKGSFKGVSTSQDVSLALMNKEVTLSFPLPWWSSYVLPVVILVGIVVLLAAIYYVIKRIRGNREQPTA